ncbi:MAG: hypothetical protein JJ975_14055 [Bacteroidia bacterium]|nr:hypothetical protein [Bacteroidia bacterium]
MKLKINLFSLLVLVFSFSQAQTEKVTVVNVDANSQSFDAEVLTSHLEILMDKSHSYNVADKYTLKEVLKSNDVDQWSCYSEDCLRKVADLMNCEWAVSGRINQLPDNIYISIRMISSNAETPSLSTKMEFLNIPEQVNTMLKLTVQQLLNETPDPVVLKSLTDKNMHANSSNTPETNALNLSGPRMGYTFFTGDAAKVLAKPKYEGGYDASPAMFLFGYQFEQQYLNGSNIQGLFEFIPQIAGLDQGMFLPSFTFLNGIRGSKTGIEFAFGPTIYAQRTVKMYYEEGQWHRPSERQNVNNVPTEERLDSRGVLLAKTNLVFAAGRSFKSGNMNFPVNVFFVPNRRSPRFGFSLGYNISK